MKKEEKTKDNSSFKSRTAGMAEEAVIVIFGTVIGSLTRDVIVPMIQEIVIPEIREKVGLEQKSEESIEHDDKIIKFPGKDVTDA